MIVLHNDDDFKKAYYYKGCSTPAKGAYPEKYPCILSYVHEEGEISGPYVIHQFYYSGRHRMRDFMAGLKAAGVS